MVRLSLRFDMRVPSAECATLADRDGQLMLHPLAAGVEPALARESLRLLETEVLPRPGGTAAP